MRSKLTNYVVAVFILFMAYQAALVVAKVW